MYLKLICFVHHHFRTALESVFGYITVLPSAFSAYRFEVIRPRFSVDVYKQGPLVKYFEREELGPLELGPFAANMYLAEDRILSFEIIGE